MLQPSAPSSLTDAAAKLYWMAKLLQQLVKLDLAFEGAAPTSSETTPHSSTASHSTATTDRSGDGCLRTMNHTRSAVQCSASSASQAALQGCLQKRCE